MVLAMMKIPGSWFTWYLLSLIALIIMPYAASTTPQAPEIAALAYLLSILVSGILLLISVSKTRMDPLVSTREDILILLYGVCLGVIVGVFIVFSPVHVKAKVFTTIITVIVEFCLIAPTIVDIIRGIIRYGLAKLIVTIHATLIAIIALLLSIILLRSIGSSSPFISIIILASIVLITSIDYMRKRVH